MSELVVTVHKPQQPPIPEPEGWIILEYCSGGWWVDSGYLVKPSERESLEDAVSTIKNTPIRLVHIGPAPKVPVRDIQLAVSTLRAAANSTELGARESLLNCAARLTHWLGESEREKGGRE